MYIVMDLKRAFGVEEAAEIWRNLEKFEEILN